jgi:sec-independent protein translocase protein TatC
MTVAEPPTPPQPKPHFDPDEYRMTIGEHLEELRRRMIIGLLGFGVTLAFCLFFGDRVLELFCAPLTRVQLEMGLNPQIHYDDIGEGFMVWLQVNVITAVALASPWIVYQLWLFVAAGLYPHERKYVTRYAPLSILLLIAGMLFVYYLVLPWTLSFFISFATQIPLYPAGSPHSPSVQNTAPLPSIPSFAGDPNNAVNGNIWYDSFQKRLKVMWDGKARVLPFGPDNLIAPHITLPEYVDLVVGMLVVFALAFQLPLVVLALLSIGIVELDTARSARKYVYFAMVIAAAVITPGDVITATIALMIPLCMLYELGIFLYVLGKKKKPQTPEAA